MQNNYNRLFQELQALISDKEVRQNLDQNIKGRINSLLQKNQSNVLEVYQTANSIQKQIDEDCEGLFDAIDLKKYTQNNVKILGDSTNLIKKIDKPTSNSTEVINRRQSAVQCQKQGRTKQKKNSSSSKGKLSSNKNTQSSNKNLIRYSTQTASKSKSKEKIKLKTTEKGQKTKATLKVGISGERGKKVSMFDHEDKQNVKIYTHKRQDNFKKVKPVQQFNYYLQQKLIPKYSKINQSRQILKRLATLETQPSRISNISQIQQRSQKKSIQKRPISRQNTLIYLIESKQGSVNDERHELEQQIQQLLQRIEKQKAALQNSNSNITKLRKEINKRQSVQKNCSIQVKLSRKKSQNYFSQAKQIQQEIYQFNKNKELVLNNIQEQKYLINMYITVIEEMKCQIKIEQSEKVQLRKKLMFLKNTQKMSMQKYFTKEAVNNQMFRSMHQSLKKWG